MGCHCTPKGYELTGRSPFHRSCSDNFEECFREYGISLEDLDSAGVFNAFMNVKVDGGRFEVLPSPAKKGDYIYFLAEMDVLVGFSCCPEDNACNNFEPKAMMVQIRE